LFLGCSSDAGQRVAGLECSVSTCTSPCRRTAGDVHMHIHCGVRAARKSGAGSSFIFELYIPYAIEMSNIGAFQGARQDFDEAKNAGLCWGSLTSNIVARRHHAQFRHPRSCPGAGPAVRRPQADASRLHLDPLRQVQQGRLPLCPAGRGPTWSVRKRSASRGRQDAVALDSARSGGHAAPAGGGGAPLPQAGGSLLAGL
jgi:hypothetical protein